MDSDEGMECPVCWEGFNDTENTPYVLWCGHSLCRNCVLGLPWSVIKFKFPFVPVKLPLFITCPWCQYLTVRVAWKGALKYPCKNFFLLWIVDRLNGDTVRQRPQVDAVALARTAASVRTVRNASSNLSRPRQRPTIGEPLVPLPPGPPPRQRQSLRNFLVEVLHGSMNLALWQLWLARLTAFFVQLTVKLPMVLLFLFIICYVLPFSTIILALYCFVTVVFALPSLLIVYFSYPGLDWLAREIVTT